MSKSRFNNLDDAVEHIAQSKGGGHVEQASEAQQESETTSRWWSYNSKQGIGEASATENQAVEHRAADHEMKRDRDPNGVQYQKCRGGRRVIRKRIGGE